MSRKAGPSHTYCSCPDGGWVSNCPVHPDPPTWLVSFSEGEAFLLRNGETYTWTRTETTEGEGESA